MIEKLRHGSEIESSKLNEMIEAINKNDASHDEIRTLAESIKTLAKDVYNKLETYSEQVSENLEAIPEVKNLYADILLARDSVDWIDINEDETDIDAFIAHALSGYEGDKEEPAERLKIIRGTTNQINLNTPAIKDKQILIAYDNTNNKGILYFDINNTRIPVSASGNVSITASVPTFEFIQDGDQVKLQMKVGGQVSGISPNLKGATGSQGVQGVQGPQGIKGDKGDKGEQGLPGTIGQDGATTLMAIYFSNYSDGRNASETYSSQKYMGIKTYLSTDSEATVSAQPIKWFRISGDTLYPIYDSETGYLTFTTQKPEESSFYIRGPKGDKGDTGATPTLAFKLAEDKVITLQSISSEGAYIYDLSALKGDKGDQGDPGEQGKKGDKGNPPTIKFVAESTTEEEPSVIDVTPSNGQYDAVFKLKVPKGKDGDSVTDAITSNKGELLLILSSGKVINLGNIKGDKGDKGEPGTIEIKGLVNNVADLPITKVNPGDCYVVTSIENDVEKNNLYICVDNSKTTYSEIYKNIGNIKGDKGNPGQNGLDGSVIHNGNLVTEAGINLVINAVFKEGDYYLNTNTYDLYRIESVPSVKTYTISKVGNIKGAKGETGATGATGANGMSITSVQLKNTEGKQKTYSILSGETELGTFNITDGIDGTNGKDGTNGSKIYSGTEESANDNTQAYSATIGDYYLCLANEKLYKKTGLATWEYQCTLQGTNGINGTNGKDGTKISKLTNLTIKTTDQEGDLGIYNNNLYECQLTNSDTKQWVNIGNLKGDAGLQGRPQRVFTITSNTDFTSDIITLPINSEFITTNPINTNYSKISVGDLVLILDSSNKYYGTVFICTEVTTTTVSFTLLQAKQATKISNNNTGSVTVSLNPNEICNLTSSNISNITVTLNSSSTNYNNPWYEVSFKVASTSLTVTLPDNLTFANDFTTEDFAYGYTYILHIENNIIYVNRYKTTT